MMTSVICNRFEGYFNFRKTNSSGTFVILVTVLVWVIYLLISFNGIVFMLNDKSVTGTLITNSLAASDNLRLFSHFNSNNREKTRNLCKNFTMKLKKTDYIYKVVSRLEPLAPSRNIKKAGNTNIQPRTRYMLLHFLNVFEKLLFDADRIIMYSHFIDMITCVICGLNKLNGYL